MKSLVTRRQAIAATSALVFAPFVAKAQEKVGMQLILAADVSGSVNQQRYKTQQDGYLEALGDVARAQRHSASSIRRSSPSPSSNGPAARR